jgi:hypothetical protein
VFAKLRYPMFQSHGSQEGSIWELSVRWVKGPIINPIDLLPSSLPAIKPSFVSFWECLGSLPETLL